MPLSQRTTRDKMNRQLTNRQEEGRPANKVLPKTGVKNFYKTFVLNSILVFQMDKLRFVRIVYVKTQRNMFLIAA